jgi:hypothetical protein
MSYDASDNQADTDNPAEQVAMFVLGDNPGLSVNVDDDDNDANHGVLVSDSGTMVSFTVFNVGTASGVATVSLEVDGNWVKDWTSSDIGPKGSESTEVRGLGRYPKGSHEFVAYVNPSAGYEDYRKNTVDVADP